MMSDNASQSTNLEKDGQVEDEIENVTLKPTYPAPLSKCGSDLLRRFSFSLSNRVTKRVIAPYVKVVRRGRERKTEREEEKKFSFSAQRKPSVLTRNISEFLSDYAGMCSVIHETIDVLKTTCKAKGVNLYMVDSAIGVLHQNPRESPNERYRVLWKIEPNHTIAAAVAYQKQYIMVDDIVADTRFPEGIGFKDVTIKSVLCAPVVNPDNTCLAVIELYRDVSQPVFGREDLKIVVVLAGWIGVAIHQNQKRTELQNQADLHDYMLNINKFYFSGKAGREGLMKEVVDFARLAVGAERGSFYTINPDSDPLEGRVYEYGIDETGTERMFKKYAPIKFKPESGIPGIVARTNELVNIVDSYKDERFNKEFDEKFGFISRNILAVPIRGVDKNLGVIQLVNKVNGNAFNAEDENKLNTIVRYCYLELEFSRLKEECNKLLKWNQCFLGMLDFHMLPCSHDLANAELDDSEEIPDAIHEFSWYIPDELLPSLPRLTFYMFSDILKDSEINEKNMTHFILSVKKSYRENPYHSYTHAFNVQHCMYAIIKRNIHYFQPTEIKAALIASLCHDIDHRGNTNNFLQLTNDPIHDLYEDSSLENHHYYVTMMLLKRYEIFNSMSETEFEILSKEIKYLILATNLSRHFKVRRKLTRILYDGTLDLQNEVHRNYIKAIMMTVCDLSGLCKPYPISKKITEDLYREFYNQGDIEKTFGVCPLTMMDREKVHLIPENQEEFLSVIVIPATELLLIAFPNTEDLHKAAKKLRDVYTQLIELRGQKVWKQHDSIVKVE